ncbi:MAG TPA: TRAP transporter large permease [Gammaproteobacteria bacterium]|nr:TRAP transporter large permease [Gammaproteobacteria bacterium]
MTPFWIGIVGIAILLLLIAIRCPIALAMAVVGFFGFAVLVAWGPAASVTASAPLELLSSYGFSPIPLFIFMGALASRSGMASELFSGARSLFGGWRGGSALAALSACGVFSAISGSSVATAATMTRVALPEMERNGYSPALATGALAAGGTLGIMIPPSIALLLYGLITEQSVGDMFIAGLTPGLLGLLMYSITVALVVYFRPSLAAASPSTVLMEKLKGIAKMGPFLLMFAIVMGGLYGGLFTPTEAAGIGAFVTLIVAVFRGLRLPGFMAAVSETLVTSALIFFMLMGAEVFGYFLSVSRLPFTLAEVFSSFDLAPLGILLCVLLLYMVLGCFMDSIAMMLLTVPVVYPLILQAGFDPIWFGVVTVLAVELGLITPPVGMNVFVINATARHIPLGQIFRGVVPFIVSDLLRLALLVAFPAIALWLL